MARDLIDCINDLRTIHDELLVLKDSNTPFNSERAGQIMERYEKLVKECREAYYLAKKRGVNLKGVQKFLPFEIEPDLTH